MQLRPAPSGMPYMTTLYDSFHVAKHSIEMIRWTENDFAVVLSHEGLTHHQGLVRRPLADRR